MNIEQQLKKHGYSFTKQRKDIFKEITKLHHFSYDDLQRELKGAGIASIFRTLNLFVEIGIINKVNTNSSAVLYEISDEGNHHEHMSCNSCGRIYEFDDSSLHDFFEKIAKQNNFLLENHSLSFEGKCKSCIEGV